jgi:hypothetical protein
MGEGGVYASGSDARRNELGLTMVHTAKSNRSFMVTVFRCALVVRERGGKVCVSSIRPGWLRVLL